MLRTVLNEEKSYITVRGEFFDLDKIYFMNERLAGTYGIGNTCLLDGYGEAASMLKGLNYEIRHAERGDRDIYVAYNGIRDEWFAPEGIPDYRIVKEEDLHEPEEAVNEIEDAVMFDLNLDLDDFLDKDEEEQRELLDDLDLDPDLVDSYFDWMYKAQVWPFRSEDYPGASEKNTYLSFDIPFAEGVLYALLYRDLLDRREEYVAKSLLQAKENKNGWGAYEFDFCKTRMQSELCLVQLLMSELFASVYSVVGEEGFEMLQEKLPVGVFQGLTMDGVKKIEDVMMRYPGEEKEDFVQLVEEMRKIVTRH